MSRPTSFFRSNRRSTQETTFTQSHARAVSYGGAALDPRATSTGPDMQRSASTSRNTSTMTRGMERLEKRRNMEERNFLKSKARSQNLNPPVDLRSLDYVATCDENLTCPICRCPFVDPVVLAECDHYFCRDCIRQAWTVSNTYNPLGPRGDCPSCRTPAKLGPRSATSKLLLNIVDDLLVKCPKADEGCKVEVKRGEVQHHISIYCGFAMIECPEDRCELPVRRKDSKEGCLHYPVSCIACREEMQKCYLEKHWRTQCPDRKVICELCKVRVFYRDLSTHKTTQCSANVIPCAGRALGCGNRSMKSQADVHARKCSYARMAPLFTAITQRMDEQEAAQKEMSRKLEVLETGFSSMHSILYPRVEDPDRISADPSSIPLLQGHGGGSSEPSGDIASALEDAEMDFATFDMVSPHVTDRSARDITSRQVPDVPGPRPAEMPEPFSQDFELASPFPPPATDGPYASPLHHLLSMHESLRDEMSRVSTALQEVDGRHQMQTLNENLRTREEMSYLTAQVAGLSRQVHWLTSAQLQRQSRSGTPGAPGEAGPSVGAAISSAVQGAARMVGSATGREGMPPMPVRRGTSEEGRTKL
ncbi:Putative Zinc finger, TRAF-type, Zinc finger, RING-type, Zinc finger, RING/FYVE/PHD-type [Septoria linicola]|uniref:Zinc finger, TRAF-type, Zinc finger, RING-type, Zinc finger, RING/FYVE/PHD-type n=1 Tax=Septoria linicola TaxID=215465 RepID=A0A9Q9AWI3_9PEZI|nr:Putative Zinc finger, TRAF-type, Zinc finger, RING-type, Zinc finger, RING/FYVE/PHD-type [Septoria linicola]